MQHWLSLQTVNLRQGIVFWRSVKWERSSKMSHQEDYARGYSDGYKSVQGNVIPPIAPIGPMTPLGSDPYEEGYKAGVEAAGG